jgi:hypothetical protein
MAAEDRQTPCFVYVFAAALSMLGSVSFQIYRKDMQGLSMLGSVSFQIYRKDMQAYMCICNTDSMYYDIPQLASVFNPFRNLVSDIVM